MRLAIQKAGGDLVAPLVNGSAAADIAASFQVGGFDLVFPARLDPVLPLKAAAHA